ncbi:unnamed protein product [Didymodactylos carnosus]|uniref:Hemoglobinase n=1 Tax=Didymodactylos carnosus TaxID=1234261 RepID=A0A8S2GJD8_9BILA|nr:unnamed protein product [Didymodactylos carnosus]CAF3525313.1 unnamed protein product [Didymodactylos carnosus]
MHFLKLQVQHGGDIHDVILATNSNDPCVEELQQHLQNQLNIPQDQQRIMFKGQNLHDKPEGKLRRYGITNTSLIRVVGPIVIALLALYAHAAGQHWAVIVAGSNGYYNYRHQADVCHAYQILHKHGIPDDNIVVMMYDDIANDPSNPTKGVIINHPNGKDVYKGVPKDYVGETVTPKNFLNVILGNTTALKGIGIEKHAQSNGPDDNVFIFFTDHGAAGLVAFPSDVLYAKDFNTAIKKMHTEKKYKQMVIYIEACESGSMLEDLLADNINVYGTTASNAEESSYACYYDEKRQTYLGDVYSVVWMEDSDAEKIDAETLFKQFQVTKKKTNTSHVMQYGDLKLGKAHMVAEFQGEVEVSKPPRNPTVDYYNDLLRRDAVPTEDVRLSVIARRLAASEANSENQRQLQKELEQLLQDRSTIQAHINEIAAVSVQMNRANLYETVIQQRMKITNHECYKSVTQHVHKKCFDLQIQYYETMSETTKFHFIRKNYFSRLVQEQQQQQIISLSSTNSTVSSQTTQKIRHALEYFVEDIRRDRDITIAKFLDELLVNDILINLAKMLLSDDERICGNVAFIIGSLVETEYGLKRFIDVFNNNKIDVNILQILCTMLKKSDPECVLNSAGSLGTICGSKEGRDFALYHPSLKDIVSNAADLLNSSNTWIASNSALVLARASVEEIGCKTILTHQNNRFISKRLVSALKTDDPGRSTNAAFAIARLCETDDGRRTIVNAVGQEELFNRLSSMLTSTDDTGLHKNACYALSCICNSSFGIQLLIQSNVDDIVAALEDIVMSDERETAWFAIMCLRTLADFEDISKRLRASKKLKIKLKHSKEKWLKYNDVQDELKLLWYTLHKNIKPTPPSITTCNANYVEISWELSTEIWDSDVQFRVFLDNIPIKNTPKTNCCIADLKPNSNYTIQLQYIMPWGESALSEPVKFKTEDELPPPVSDLRVIRTSMTATRISWQPPVDSSKCGIIKGYHIYLDDNEIDYTHDCSVTVGNLSPNITYQISVATNKGKGPKITVSVTTSSAGDTSPDRPIFPVVGRREITVKWQPPEVLAGRFTRYELISNGKSVYSGTELEYHLTMLRPDTEYTMEVVVYTNEGKFRSKPSKARTQKDDYIGRQSLYETPTQSTKVKKIDPSSPHGSPPIERRLSKDFKDIRNIQNVQMTTVRSLQLKSDNNLSSNNRILPILAAVNSRNNNSSYLRRARTDVISSHRSKTNFTYNPKTIPPPRPFDTSHSDPTDYKISVVTPCFEINEPALLPLVSNGGGGQVIGDYNRQVTWSLPITNRIVTVRQESTPRSTIRPTPSVSVPNSDVTTTANLKRKTSSSLPDLKIGQKTRSVIH